MSNKTRTRENRTTTNNTTGATGTTGPTRTPQAVSNQDTATKVRTDSEDKLWTALHTNPNGTTTDLANTAKIGKSTAGKILAKWQKDGSVTRTPGIAQGGGRAADRWTITDTGADTEPTDHTPTDNPQTNDTAPDNVSASDTDPTDGTQTAPTAPETTSVKLSDAEFSDVQPVHGDSTEATSTGHTDSEPTDSEPTNTEAIDTATAESGVEARTPAADNAATGRAMGTEGSEGDGKKGRLAPGALRGKVEDHLRDHPGEEFGPTAIAKALGGKSSGAVSNALDKLVADGTAVKTKESPRRFALAMAERAAASTATK